MINVTDYLMGKMDALKGEMAEAEMWAKHWAEILLHTKAVHDEFEKAHAQLAGDAAELVNVGEQAAEVAVNAAVPATPTGALEKMAIDTGLQYAAEKVVEAITPAPVPNGTPEGNGNV